MSVRQGGFGAWQAAGLAVKSAAEYDTTALDAITDEVEAIATNTKRIVTYLRWGARPARLPKLSCAVSADALSQGDGVGSSLTISDQLVPALPSCGG